jgi:hypothetical protein
VEEVPPIVLHKGTAVLYLVEWRRMLADEI